MIFVYFVEKRFQDSTNKKRPCGLFLLLRCRLRSELGLDLIDDLGKGIFVEDRDVGQHLAVDADLGTGRPFMNTL